METGQHDYADTEQTVDTDEACDRRTDYRRPEQRNYVDWNPGNGSLGSSYRIPNPYAEQKQIIRAKIFN